MNRILFLCFCLLSFFKGNIFSEEIYLATEYRVDTMWATAYQVTVKITNQSNQPTESWISTFSLPQENNLTTHVSSGMFSVNGKNVTVKNLTSNGTIAAKGSVTFNMIINMPQSGRTTIENLLATGSTSLPTDPILAAPILNPISSTSAKDYTVSWNDVDNATTYYLESDTSSNFTNPKTVIQGDVLTISLTDQPAGTYFYRVAAGNSSGKSAYSNIESISVALPDTTTPLSAVYKIDPVWATAFQANVTLTNNTNVIVKNWTAQFTLPQGFSLSSHVFSGVFTSNGQNVTVKNLSNNGTISPGASVTFSMIINIPKGAKAQINNLQAIGNGSFNPTPLPIPSAPIIQLQSTSESSYVVSWNSVANASSYTLQEDTHENFSEAKTITEGNILSQAFINKTSGTYYYRVLASNFTGNSSYSNVVSIIVINDNPIPSRDTIEYSEWYIDWTAWFDDPIFVIPKNANMINIFVGQLTTGPDGKPTLGGFGNFTLPQIKAFTDFLAAQPAPMHAKVSIGGSGGMYDRTWDKLNSSNIKAYAQGMVDFCHQLGLAGVDFDYEAFVSREQEALVGTLIKEFKILDPKLQTSLCSNAGFGPFFPWPEHMKAILDAAMIAPGNCAVDRFYIMSYYNTMADEIGWIVGNDGKGGWTNWLITNYGFSRARISVGIDDFDAHAYDPEAFKAWAIKEGFSVAHWAFDPANPK